MKREMRSIINFPVVEVKGKVFERHQGWRSSKYIANVRVCDALGEISDWLGR